MAKIFDLKGGVRIYGVGPYALSQNFSQNFFQNTGIIMNPITPPPINPVPTGCGFNGNDACMIRIDFPDIGGWAEAQWIGAFNAWKWLGTGNIGITEVYSNGIQYVVSNNMIDRAFKTLADNTVLGNYSAIDIGPAVVTAI